MIIIYLRTDSFIQSSRIPRDLIANGTAVSRQVEERRATDANVGVRTPSEAKRRRDASYAGMG